MTTVTVNTYTHSVTYVADNILKSLKDILVLSGLDPTNMTDSWQTKLLGIKTWLQSGHLERVSLEIFDPRDDELILRWDLEVVYGWSASGDGNFYTDTDLFKYHIRKTGLIPSQARYRIILQNKDGRPDVPGWGPADYKSTYGMVKQSLGSAIEHHGLGTNAGYWRRS